jgi:Tfp pilus assembly protein PilN
VSSKLNLASQPFRNRALPWGITTLVVFVSLIAIVWIFIAANRTAAEKAAVDRDQQRLKGETSQLEQRKSALQAALGQDEMRKLGAAQSLVERKRFSWTRMLSDLEKALPGTVRVTRISVREVSSRGDHPTALLDMTVIAKSPENVTNMIAEMDRGGVFQADPVAQNLRKGRGETGTEWVLSVRYNLPAGAPAGGQRGNRVAADLTASNATAEVRR